MSTKLHKIIGPEPFRPGHSTTVQELLTLESAGALLREPTVFVTFTGERDRSQAVVDFLAELGYERFTVRVLSGNAWPGYEVGAGHFKFQEKTPELSYLRELVEAEFYVDGDVAVQPSARYLAPKRLVVMDIDSTLIEIEVVDELAKICGAGEQVAAITAEAMAGNIDFDESLKRRVALLRGLRESRLTELASNLPLTNGAETLVRTLKRQDTKVAIVSGGFTNFASVLKQKLGLDYALANTLEVSEGTLTGRVSGKIVNASGKSEFLEELRIANHFAEDGVVAIGDGANDIAMLRAAGLGIAFNAKPKTREAADAALNRRDLSLVLYLLGYSGWQG